MGEELEEVVDAEVVEGGELAIQQQPGTLFRTDDPVKVIQRATEVADALRDVIRKQRLAVQVKSKWHVLVEGWQTCGAMLGVVSVCEWTRPVEDGWEARVVVRTLDGREIGAAEAQCLSTEGKPWNTAKGHAIRSMAQTRATSKALGSVLRFVITLAGYEGTPAEEATDNPAAAPAQDRAEAVETIDEDRTQAIGAAISAAALPFEQLCTVFGAAGADAPKIDRGDSKYKAVRGMTPEQADAFEAALAKVVVGG